MAELLRQQFSSFLKRVFNFPLARSSTTDSNANAIQTTPMVNSTIPNSSITNVTSSTPTSTALAPSKLTIVSTRFYYPEATTSVWTEEGKDKVICSVLERPKLYKGKENQRDITGTTLNESCCIPEGTYEIIWTWSNAFKGFRYEVKNVKDRDGIRIHSANWISELLGCMAPCLKITVDPKATSDKKYQATSSKLGLQALYDYIGKDRDKQKPFTLKILSNKNN